MIGQQAGNLQKMAREADAEAIALIASEIGVQEARLVEANTKLASPKPTKKAENDRRITTNKIGAGKKKLDDMASPAPADGRSQGQVHFPPSRSVGAHGKSRNHTLRSGGK